MANDPFSMLGFTGMHEPESRQFQYISRDESFEYPLNLFLSQYVTNRNSNPEYYVIQLGWASYSEPEI